MREQGRVVPVLRTPWRNSAQRPPAVPRGLGLSSAAGLWGLQVKLRQPRELLEVSYAALVPLRQEKVARTKEAQVSYVPELGFQGCGRS